MKYARQFLLIFFLVGFCIITLYSSYMEVKDKSIDYLNRQQTTYARQAARNIQEFFDSYLRKLNVMSHLDGIVSLDAYGMTTMQIFYESNSDEVITILRVDASGNIIHAVPHNRDIIGTNLSHMEDIKKITQNHQSVVGDVFATPEGSEAVAMNVPVLQDGFYRGCIRILIPFNYLAKRYLDDIRIGEEGYAWMIDAKGIEIFCPVPGHIGRTVFENCKDFPSILAMAREMIGGREGTTLYEFNHVRGETVEVIKKHAVYYPVWLHNTFWSIVVATPEEEVLGNILGFRNRLLFTTLILLVAFVLQSHFFLRSFIKVKEEEKRKQAEAALAENEQQLREVFQGLPIPTMVIGKNHRIVRWNRAMEVLTGFGSAEVLGTDHQWMPFYREERPCMADLLVDDEAGLIPEWYLGKWSPSEFLDGAFEATDFFDQLGDAGKWLHLTVSGIRDSHGNLVGAIETIEDITDRKRTEEALISANQQLNDIIEFLPDATFVVDNDRKIIAWNRAIEEMTGVSKKEMIGKGDYERTIPFYGDRRLHLLDLLDRNDDAVQSGYQYIEKRGNVLCAETFIPLAYGGKGAYVFGTVAPLFDAHGNRVGAIESIRDVTDRKLAEEALKESQQQLADIIDFLPDATFVVDREGRIIAWNRAIEDMTGVNASDMLGKCDYEYALPFYGVRRPILIDLVLESETGFESEYESMQRVDAVLEGEAYTPALKGSGAYLYGKASILRDSKGAVVGAIESIRDITERKRVEEARMLAEEKYRSIFENAIEGIFQTTLDGCIISANPAFARIVGYESPEEVLKALTDVSRQLYVDPDRRSEMLRQLDKFGKVQEFEVRFYRKDGSIAYISLNARAVRGESGQITFLEGTVQDVTDRKALESRLLQAQKMEAIGTLAGGIAHDFNNILAAIMGYTEMTRNKLVNRPELQLYLDQVLKSCDRAKHLVAQILTFSRKADQEIRPVDLGPLVKEALKMLRATLPSTIDIQLNHDPDICAVLAEPTHIHQVIVNLCTNAAHAMREKGGVLDIGLKKIDVTPQTAIFQSDMIPGPYILLSVSDTGIGIPPAIVNRIFDPFFTTKERGEGTGLGLSVVYGIVKGCGGVVTVHSEVGNGSVFRVYLPAIAHEQESEADPLAPAPRGSERILFVDDESTLVKMARESLHELGYRVVATRSSEKALELFRSRPDRFDLVITDMTMPGMTGASLAVELMKIRPDIPIILCTGFSEIITEEQARHLGIREFILKPVSFREISRVIRRILGESEFPRCE